MITFRVVLATLIVQVAIAMAATYLGGFGGWLAVGDSLAVLRVPFAILILIGGAGLWFLGGRRIAIAAIAFGLFAVVPIGVGFLDYKGALAGEYTLYQKNLLRKKLLRNLLVKDMFEANADFLTLQEMTEHDTKYMKQLFDSYPVSVICGEIEHSGTAVMSRLPLVEGTETCLLEERVAAVQVVRRDGVKMWVVAIHLDWPFPYGQSGQVASISKWLKTLDGPVLIGGDFNMVPWGSSVGKLAKAAGAYKVGPTRISFPDGVPFMPLAIDHVLAPKGAEARTELRPLVGSDHYGIVARINF